MTSPRGDIPNGREGLHEPHDQIDELDLLISRLIDGEATEAEMDRFAGRARSDAGSIRTLAERQADQGRLAAVVAAEIAPALAVGLPSDAIEAGASADVETARVGVLHVIRPVVSYLGWAAAIALTLFVALWEPNAPPAEFINYEAAEPHILEERLGRPLDPVLIHSEELPDGRWKFMIIDRSLREIIADRFDRAWIEKRPADDHDARGETDL